jgi:hypothetical protein
MRADTDPLLRRVERTAVVACVLMAGAAFVLGGGRWAPVAGVLGGGLLVAVSYRTIGSGVAGLVELLTAGERSPAGADPEGTTPRAAAPGVAWTMVLVLVLGRYALLALLAYVMIARLRLHPLGLLAGASSFVAAASIEALRLLMKKKS